MKNKRIVSAIFILFIIISFSVLLLPRSFAIDSPNELVGQAFMINDDAQSGIIMNLYYGNNNNYYYNYYNSSIVDNFVFIFFPSADKIIESNDWTNHVQRQRLSHDDEICFDFLRIMNRPEYDTRTRRCNTDILTDISKYWKVEAYLGMDNYSYYQFALVPASYEEPRFSLTCDKKLLKKGESSQCSVKVSNRYNLSNIKFNLSHEDFSISDIKPGNLYNLNSNDDGVELITKNSNNIGDNNTLLTFKLTAINDKYVNTIDNVKVVNINYKDEVKTSTAKDLSATIKQNKSIFNIISNPKTNRETLIFLSIIVVIVGTLFLITKKFNKNS